MFWAREQKHVSLITLTLRGRLLLSCFSGLKLMALTYTSCAGSLHYQCKETGASEDN